MLIGNKCDCNEQRVISREEGEAFAQEKNLLFSETSAKKSIGVDKAFKAVAENI